ncbi:MULTISPECIES: ABC transporter ATP-binding protein [unclassified Peribacillus]|jgi:iron complex transport system ATP-binding protein|uniref:ABC transporter ATP-binding protein n=1 Tax=unclassified Peribacillus TaxID=2675266 RepID=UPI001911F2D6|nr:MULTISPECIES: ABC transporter ATP-binding protein [unclassified Peribacillus]MBK5446337.1 ABC transporter ATP-binding protein [Peribacillus sp. TH24]MBK5458995.1 ABC transporter ATP-binding protein [Peribacillus sp. TH27]MBK5502359.1 ABC transporter ATP-binding protein [Peribacillus sp. TH14]WMX57722.1 ABC transporter ATP-binding protein [Peribacillus sp. R9-11]
MNQTKTSNNVISLKNINWKRNGNQILNGVSWEVQTGEHWALLGLNGSGKTSLLKMITGYQWPNSGGEVSVLGNIFGKTNIPELRKSIGWVSSSLDQEYQSRPNDTALEVVLSGKFASIGLYEEITENDVKKANKLLDQFRIKHLSNQFIQSLSQGEKRKAMIARALMSSPRLLILDEPCNGLDIYSKEELLTTIEDMTAAPNGPTILYVTHHIEEIVPSITHALLINSGNVIAKGDKKNTLTESLLEKTFRVPITLEWENDRPWIRIKSMLATVKN